MASAFSHFQAFFQPPESTPSKRKRVFLSGYPWKIQEEKAPPKKSELLIVQEDPVWQTVPETKKPPLAEKENAITAKEEPPQVAEKTSIQETVIAKEEDPQQEIPIAKKLKIPKKNTLIVIQESLQQESPLTEEIHIFKAEDNLAEEEPLAQNLHFPKRELSNKDLIIAILPSSGFLYSLFLLAQRKRGAAMLIWVFLALCL